MKTWQALASPDHPTDEATLRAWAQHDRERAYNPDGLIRLTLIPQFVDAITAAASRKIDSA